jgi:hypothetical protein
VTTRNSTVKSSHALRASAPLALLLCVLATPAGCSQPQVRCHASGGEGIARYALVGGVPSDAACANLNLPLLPNSDPSTFPFGVESYVPSPTDPNAGSEPGSIAIKAEWIGNRIFEAEQASLPLLNTSFTSDQYAELANYPYGTGKAPDPPPTGAPSTNFPYAWGAYDTVYPDPSTGLCQVTTMRASDMDYPAIPAHQDCNENDSSCLTGGAPGDAADFPPTDVDAVPETKVKYAWSNVRTFVTPTSIGAQTFGDLAITQDGCTVSYHVSILVPRVQCNVTDDNGNVIGNDPKLCDPNPDGDENPQGSGITQAVTPSCENIGSKDNPDWECLPPP